MSERKAAICHEGEVFWRGTGEQWFHQPLPEAVRLRDQFAAVAKTDWIKPTAKRYAAELTTVINQAQQAAETVAEQRVGMMEAV